MKILFDSSKESSNGQVEKPWHNEYSRQEGSLDNEYIVEQVILCQQGLLLLTKEFKDFVFRGKQAYKYLVEALEYFTKNPKDSIPIVLKVTQTKSASIGTIEDYEGSGTWVQESKGYRFLEHLEPLTPSTDSNPFIPPTTRSRKKKQ